MDALPELNSTQHCPSADDTLGGWMPYSGNAPYLQALPTTKVLRFKEFLRMQILRIFKILHSFLEVWRWLLSDLLYFFLSYNCSDASSMEHQSVDALVL